MAAFMPVFCGDIVDKSASVLLAKAFGSKSRHFKERGPGLLVYHALADVAELRLAGVAIVRTDYEKAKHEFARMFSAVVWNDDGSVTIKPRPLPPGVTVVQVLEYLAVQKGMRNKGVGQRIMSTVFQNVPADGMLILSANNPRKMQTQKRLRRFYKACAELNGFRVVMQERCNMGFVRTCGE